jgi:hypothetical protein
VGLVRSVCVVLRQRIWAAVRSRSSRGSACRTVRSRWRMLVLYLSKREVRRDARQAKVRAREQLDLWERVCRGEPPFRWTR